jgi:hypothetical protein
LAASVGVRRITLAGALAAELALAANWSKPDHVVE